MAGRRSSEDRIELAEVASWQDDNDHGRVKSPGVMQQTSTSTSHHSQDGTDGSRATISDPPADFRVETFPSKKDLAGFNPAIANDEKNSWRIYLSRRSRALMIQVGVIGLILLTNLGLTIFAITQYGSKNGVGLIYQGSCGKVKNMNRWLHLLINLMSTGMLSASNYGMQLQAAPTRANVDTAHGLGKWLDIGVPSLRNLRYISKTRKTSWILLALSSLPIHLIYNSAIFQSLSSHMYTVAVVKNSFLDRAPFNLTAAEARSFAHDAWTEHEEERYGHAPRINPSDLDYSAIIHEMQDDVSNYEALNVSECFDLYDDYWQPQGNVVIQVRNESVQLFSDDSVLIYVSIIPRADDWAKNMWAVGNGTAGFYAVSPDKPVTKWFLGPPHYEVAQCLAQSPDSLRTDCRLEYAPGIMYVICSMNMIKAFIMLAIWVTRKWQGPRQKDADKEVLYTLGDAIASFMRRPEDKTKNMGLMDKSDFLSKRTWKTRLIRRGAPAFVDNDGNPINPEPRNFKPINKRWRSAASLRRWVILVGAWLTIILVAAVLLGITRGSLGPRKVEYSIPSFWSLGFGAIHPLTFLVINLPRSDPTGLIANVLLANLPQLIVSILYILFNTMLSTFLVQREWSKMCDPTHRKTLRVSEPIGLQRGSYFISLPLRYGVPMYVSSGLLHWLISQSLFLARIRAVDTNGKDNEKHSFSTCGYSPIAIFVTLLVGFAILIILIGISMKKYDSTMRMVSTNSLAISAACHVVESDEPPHYFRQSAPELYVQWGVVMSEGGIGKVAFTTAAAAEVLKPDEGRKYC